jgi:trans-aconitate 2-methyltransferase
VEIVMSDQWDPDRYLGYADERGRPFVDLLARVGANDPREVVDLGCGPGNLTALLRQRWPQARVRGVDSSPAMVERARAAGIETTLADVRDWQPAEPVDVLVTNAALQWVPGHLDLLPRLVAAVRPGGWFAMQVPGNFGELSHTVREELAAEPPYAEHLADIARPGSHPPAAYWEALAAAGEADVWETTYLHVLTGQDAVFDWISGTSLRPTRAALPEELWPGFAAELRQRLRRAYPTRAGRVILPFRRIFAVVAVTG